MSNIYSIHCNLRGLAETQKVNSILTAVTLIFNTYNCTSFVVLPEFGADKEINYPFINEYSQTSLDLIYKDQKVH